MFAKLFGEGKTQILVRLAMEDETHGIEVSIEDDGGSVAGMFVPLPSAEAARGLLEAMDEEAAMGAALLLIERFECEE